MPEEQKAETPVVETPTPEATPASQPENESGESQKPEATTDVKVEQGETQPKQTRAERRIEQLIGKLKTRPTAELPTQTKPEQLIRPEEIENGIDPQALQQRVEQTIQASSQQTRAQIKAELAYEGAVNDHMADLTSASENLDPSIEKLAVRQYEAINYQINPFTGQQVFMPTVKFSEIVKQIQQDFEQATASRVADATTSLAKQVQQSAVQPTGDSTERFNIKDLEKQIWNNPTGVMNQLKSRLRYSEE